MPGRKVASRTSKKIKSEDATTHIPRPRNCFMIFRSEMLKQWQISAKEHGRKSMAHASQDIAGMWKKLTPKERTYWEGRGKREKEEHKKKYPGYRYIPQKKTQWQAKKVPSTQNEDLDDLAASDSSTSTCPHCNTPDSLSSTRQAPQSRSATTSPSSSIESLSPLSLFNGLPGASPLSNTSSLSPSPAFSATGLASSTNHPSYSVSEPGLKYERTIEIEPLPLDLSALAMGSSSSIDLSQPPSHQVQVPSSWNASHYPSIPDLSASYGQPLPPFQSYYNQSTTNAYQHPVYDYKQYGNNFWSPVDGFSDGGLLTGGNVHQDFDLHSDYRNLF